MIGSTQQEEEAEDSGQETLGAKVSNRRHGHAFFDEGEILMGWTLLGVLSMVECGYHHQQHIIAKKAKILRKIFRDG